jgi:hypothetical protein
MLKKASSEFAAQEARDRARNFPKTTLAAFLDAPRKYETDSLQKNTQTIRIIEYRAKTVEIKVTECLSAKTFRDANAADIGYACLCYANYAASQAFNPKIKLIRSKTLMQGDNCCNHRWVLEE